VGTLINWQNDFQPKKNEKVVLFHEGINS